MSDEGLRCPFFLKKEERIKQITEEINRAETFGEKAEIAGELVRDADVLLSCEKYDKKNPECVNCHRISKLRKSTASLFIKPKEAAKEMTEGLSEFQGSIGGIFRGLGGFINLASKMMEEGITEVSKSGEIKGLNSKEVRGVYGFTVRSGLGGRGKRGVPKIERFGNIREYKEDLFVEESREPIVDVFDEKDHVEIIAEIPGVGEEDIKTEVKDDVLTISAESGDRKYSKEILLPKEVDTKKIKYSYKNGILTLMLKKK